MLILPLGVNTDHRIKTEKSDGDNAIIITIYYECVAGGTHMRYAPAVNDKRGYMPHHCEYTHGAPQQHHTQKTDLAKIFGGKEKGRCPKVGCKPICNGKK